jgi:hypothetical protein
VGTTTLTWVEIGAMAVGHVAAVLVAHDRTLDDVGGPLAMRSQQPIVAMIVVSAVAGLLVLLSS